MNHRILAVLITLTPLFSHAVIADSFLCKLKIQDNQGNQSSQSYEFQTMRLPLSASPAADVRLTGSEAGFSQKLETPEHSINANVTFYYNHGLKLNKAGRIIEARQQTCIALSAHFCSKKDDLNACFDGKLACLFGNDPFDPVHGWEKVPVLSNFPVFRERDLTPTHANIRDQNGDIMGVADFTCEFKGSFQ